VLAEPIVLAAVPERADPRDALITRTPVGRLEDLAEDALIGTSSPRRAAQLHAACPTLRIGLLRGNVETRLRRVREGDFDATLLAMAGLLRLDVDLSGAAVLPLDPQEFVPAAGQGALGFTARREDDVTLEILAGVEDPVARAVAQAERAVARGLGGSCWVPVAAHASVEGDVLCVTGMVASSDGRHLVRRSGAGRISDADGIGSQVADEILSGGGGEIVRALAGAM
jgi:hydroxymethylbilane synthase